MCVLINGLKSGGKQLTSKFPNFIFMFFFLHKIPVSKHWIYFAIFNNLILRFRYARTCKTSLWWWRWWYGSSIVFVRQFYRHLHIIIFLFNLCKCQSACICSYRSVYHGLLCLQKPAREVNRNTPAKTKKKQYRKSCISKIM